MRVLAVGNMYPPQHLGGYELVWRSAMRHLRALGHDVRVLTSDVRIREPDAEDAGTFRELRWYWREGAFPRLGWRQRVELERHNAATLASHLADQRAEVVSWWSMGGMSLSLLEQVRRAGLPAVAFVHDDWLVYAPKVDAWVRPFRKRRRLAALAERLTGLPAHVDLEAATRFVFVSETVRRRARQEGYALENSGIAPSGIDEAFLGLRPTRQWGWRLLYAGRLDPRKGVDDAVAALAELPAQATLTVVGDGDSAEIERVQAHAADLGVADRVLLVGMRSREELIRYYEQADVVVFPVRWREPWGLVPLEAMAIGRPVVATADGGPGEYLIDGQNCLAVPAEAPSEIARAVNRLTDEALRARLRKGGESTAAEHTERRFNEAVLSELTRAVDEAG